MRRIGHARAIMVSTGTSDEDFTKTRQILAMSEALRFICVDVANGYSQHFVEFLRKIREACPNHVILAGNVVTGEMVEELILSGADIVKVGIGPGSVCTTRVKTGVGYPSSPAIIECADAATASAARSSATAAAPARDVAKAAFGGGADFVMLGACWRPTRSAAASSSKWMDPVHEVLRHEFVQRHGQARRRRRRLPRLRGQDGAAALSRPGRKHYRARHPGGVRSTCTYVGASQPRKSSPNAPPSSGCASRRTTSTARSNGIPSPPLHQGGCWRCPPPFEGEAGRGLRPHS